MYSRAVVKRRVNPDIFKDFIKSKGVSSIRELGSLCETNERTIRRALKDKEITLNIALDLCMCLDCTFDELFGPDTSPRWKKSVAGLLKNVC